MKRDLLYSLENLPWIVSSVCDLLPALLSLCTQYTCSLIKADSIRSNGHDAEAQRFALGERALATTPSVVVERHCCGPRKRQGVESAP